MRRTSEVLVVALATATCFAASTWSLAQTNSGENSDFATDAPDIVKHQLLERLEATLAEESSSIRDRRIGAAGAVFYWMRPRPGMSPGICVSHLVEFDLAALNDPSMVVGVGSGPRYHFITPPPTAHPSFDHAGSAEADAACAGLHPESEDTFLQAKSETAATTGAWILSAAKQQLKSKHASIVARCPGKSVGECEDQFDALKLQELKWIGDCVGSHAFRPGDTCWRFGFGDGIWQIFVDRDLVARRISEVPPIVVTDRRDAKFGSAPSH